MGKRGSETKWMDLSLAAYAKLKEGRTEEAASLFDEAQRAANTPRRKEMFEKISRQVRRGLIYWDKEGLKWHIK